MSSRAVSTRDGSRVPSTARLLLGGALVLGLGATIILVLSDDARLLKMGILAALWAALVGAFLAARFRRQVADRADESSSMQAIYELELEREIAARREYELELEADAKRRAEEQSRHDIDALRAELGALRETLQNLLGGEVLVERFALAQATRMRSLNEEAHQLPRPGQAMKRLNPGQGQQVIIPGEPQTELMERVSSPQDRRDARPQPQRPQPQRPRREPAERQVQVRRPRDEDPGSGWWEPVTPPGSAPRQPEYQRPVAGDSVNSLGEGIDMSWTPSWERSSAPGQQPGRPARPPKKPQPSGPLPRPEVEGPTQIQPLPEAPEPPARTAESSMRGVAPVRAPAAESSPRGGPVRSPERGSAESSMRGAAVRPPAAETAMRGAQGRPPAAESSMRGAPVRVPEPPPPPPPVRKPEQSRVVQAPVGETSGGRRRAQDSGRHSDSETGGGRRRRADDAPTWQETLQANARYSGSHAKPVPPAEPSGSHAEGRSVNELLATYGNGDAPRRRRRRDE